MDTTIISLQRVLGFGFRVGMEKKMETTTISLHRVLGLGLEWKRKWNYYNGVYRDDYEDLFLLS